MSLVQTRGRGREKMQWASFYVLVDRRDFSKADEVRVVLLVVLFVTSKTRQIVSRSFSVFFSFFFFVEELSVFSESHFWKSVVV